MSLSAGMATASEQSKGGSPGAGDISARAISSHAKAAAPIEFGAVSTQAVGDAMALRKKLAETGSRVL